MHLGVDPDDALSDVAAQHAGLLAGHEPGTRARALDRLRTDLAAHHRPGEGVLYPSACWLVAARVPGSGNRIFRTGTDRWAP